ncbi:MAG: flagellar biosynthesis anti-sigma factor FlgM [Spirochaetaceae bacterium]|jgi:negative regulator of flagellin synthesis FlgM|nr:flagellar biosynthesis anti-sigma factor FlgM [Spirochaetaceae bacterium]
MTIGRVGPLDAVQNNSIGRTGQTAKPVKGDSVHISLEAKEKAELHVALEMVKAASDVREDRIAELKAKINDPSYLTEAIIAGTADKVLDAILGPSTLQK